MSEKPSGGRLTRVVKDAVVSLVRQADRSRSREEISAATSSQRPADPFAVLETYQQLKKQRAAAEVLEVANPFFRAHDGRAGATTEMDGRAYINFASYDYLGMNHHPAVSEAAAEAIRHYGTSVSASRVVAGERPFHRELERAIADVYGTDDAVVFVSGHATNVATIGELLGAKDLVIYDQLIHNSAMVGAELSGAARRSFPHNDLDALERLLDESRGRFENVLIVVEGLYSMDGDLPDLPRLVKIRDRHRAWLMVDEAHALGALGATGRGIAEHYGIDPREVDIWMGTMSKTLAACGGYIAGSTALVEILKFQASGFVYSVGMPPPVASAAREAIRQMLAEPDRVARLQANGQLFLRLAKEAGLDTGHSAGYSVVPIMVGDSLRAAKLSQEILARGINALPIVYPAVPMQSARLRFFITSEHTPEQIEETVRVTKEELDKLVATNFGLASSAMKLLKAGVTS